MSYTIIVTRPYVAGSAYMTADTREEAQQIAKAEKRRDPRVSVRIEKFGGSR